MSDPYDAPFVSDRDHVFLDAGHGKSECKIWAVIVLCALMMAVEIIGGSVFDSLALVVDGLHMPTHAGAMPVVTLVYTCAHRYVHDPCFVFDAGKLGGLAGYTSAIILAMITLLIDYEVATRFLSPVPIRFAGAIPIMTIGLLVNIASAWFLNGGGHRGHSHDHSHGYHHGAVHDDAYDHGEDVQHITMPVGVLTLSIFEDGVPPVSRLVVEAAVLPNDAMTAITTRPDGVCQEFVLARKSGVLKSITDILGPHVFIAMLKLDGQEHTIVSEEHNHGCSREGRHRDHDVHAVYARVLADAFVSVLAIIDLPLAKTFGWLWMDPLAGVVSALVIASWSYGLSRDTGGILVDMTLDKHIAGHTKITLKADDNTLLDPRVWRIGPGHLDAVVSTDTRQMQRGPQFYHGFLRRFNMLSHVTTEVHSLPTKWRNS